MANPYPGVLRAAAENFIVRLFEENNALQSEVFYMESLIDAAMHIITGRRWGEEATPEPTPKTQAQEGESGE